MTVSAQPTGTVTFLFTDIEGHTALWDAHPEAMAEALATHDALVRRVIESHAGYVFTTAGDAFSAAFARVDDAVTAAIEIQTELAAADWPAGCELRVRMGLHSGEADERDGDYFGPTVIRAARIMSLGHGRQVLVSAATASILAEHPSMARMLRLLGEVDLRGLSRPDTVSEIRYPGLDVEFPPLVTQRHQGNLPTVADELIGRLSDINAAGSMLSRSPLVTLVGPGGVGKTRLSVEIGSAFAGRFGDGVWFIPLAQVTDPDAVPDAVADVLGVQESADRSLTASIVAAIAGRDLLLVLDNCEHVVDAARSFAAAVVAGCSTVRIVASSRESLRVGGEQVLHVEPLAVEGDSDRDGGPAVQLFVTRARAADPSFDPSSAAETVQAICRRLDGMPLAIELAAARVRGLGLDGIAEHLDDRLRLLRQRGGDSRHQTLRATVGWSYELLDEQLQRLFCRARVFAGGFTLDSATAVLAFGDLDEFDVIDGVADLVDKSMLQVVAEQPVRRYRMLETMRQYAATIIDDAERSESEARFVDQFVTIAETEGRNVRLTDPASAFERLRSELDNLREAFRLAMAAGELDGAARMVTGLDYFAMVGMVAESRVWAEELRSVLAPDHELYVPVCGSALFGALASGDAARATLLAEMIEAADDDELIRFDALGGNAAANRFWFGGDAERCVRLYRRVLAHGEASGESLQPDVLAGMSMAQDSFDRPGAEESALQQLEIGRRQGSPYYTCYGLLALAGVRVHDDLRAARELAVEMVELARDSGLLWHHATGVRLLAHITSRLGDLDEASELFVEALDLNGVGDYGELLWYTIVNVIEHLGRLGDAEAAATALGALLLAPNAPIDNLVGRWIERMRHQIAESIGDDRAAHFEAVGADLKLAELLRFLDGRLRAVSP